MKVPQVLILFVLATFFSPLSSSAEISLDGYFIAQDSCAAYQSKKKKTNPGGIKLTVDMAYTVISKNKADASHYRVIVKTATPQERWVSVDCGKLLIDCREQSTAVVTEPVTPTTPVDPVVPVPPSSGKKYLLAMSLQPAFCQTHQQKTECQTQTADRYDADHFTLHGLWPQPKSNVFCNVSNNEKKLDKRKMWEQLPSLGLTPDTYGDLIETMPGVASYLQRHEWTKHGSCYSSTPEEYYRESIMLADQLNSSVVQELLAANIGKSVTSAEIKAKFEAAFGSGAGDKVRVKCSNGLITELWINLQGEVDSNTKLSDLLSNADNASSSCQSGVIDPVGF